MPVLQALKRPPRPSAPYLVWDVESEPAYDGEPLNTLWLGAALYAGNGAPKVVRNRDAFFRELLSDKYAGYWCYAHNGSGYDFRYLIAYLCRHGIPWEGFAAGSRLFIRACDREFIDSMAVLPWGLREAAEKLGSTTRKWDVPSDFYVNIRQYDWPAYLRDDCLSLYETITILREAVSRLGGQLRRTLASTAVDLWRRHYLTGRYIVPDAREPVEAAAREAYAGGRCEVFRPVIGAGEYWDINSSYPFAMLTPVPVEAGPARRGNAIPLSGLVYATYTIPSEEWIPPLFWRAGQGRRLYHPTGQWRGWRTADEARYLRSLYGAGAVRVERSIGFRAVDLFTPYVHALYAERSTPGPVGHVAKRLLNSLYGRTGMKRERERLVYGPTPSRPVAWLSRDLGVYAEPSESMLHDATVMPAVAATITARGRIALHKLLRDAPELAYCDTDSVITGGKLARPESRELGGVKREATLAAGRFIAPKAYRVVLDDGSETLHAKGLSSHDAATLARYLDGAPIEVGRVMGIREALRRGAPVDGPAERQTRHHSAGGNRHPDLRPYDVHELEALEPASDDAA